MAFEPNFNHKTMADPQQNQVLSLQTQCQTRILHHLDEYPTELLSLLPTRQRKELLKSLPPLDIYKLEGTPVVRDVDMNEVWFVISKLYNETENIRVTGNHYFDERFLNYRKKGGGSENDYYDRDAKVKDDWRMHFLIRTTQILLHSFDPSCLPITVEHSSRCDTTLPRVPNQEPVYCDCWGNGIDPTHHNLLQRLMAVPPHSKMARCYSNLEQRALHFIDAQSPENSENLPKILLIPLRYSSYFADDFKITALELLSMLVTDCQLRPKLLPIHCEFMYHSELYQLYLLGEDQTQNSARELLADLLSELEHIEFYWVGGMRNSDSQGINFTTNPSVHIPQLILKAVFDTPSPKLDTLCLRMYASAGQFSYELPKLDSCLKGVAPFFSTTDHAKVGSEVTLPASTPYSGLKKFHVFGDIASADGGDAISSILLHQSSIEGLEMVCTSKAVQVGAIVDSIQDLFSQPQLQFFVCCDAWRNYDFGKIFYQFLETNRDFEICVSALDHEVVIPARNQETKSSSSRRKVLKFVPLIPNPGFAGIVFVWLSEVELEVPLVVSIEVKQPPPRGNSEKSFCSFLSTCRAIKFQCKQSLSAPSRYMKNDYFTKLASNQNLRSLALNYLPSQALIDNYLMLLPAVFANSPHLEELSFLSNKLNTLPHEKLVKFFECLVSCPRPEQLSVDLRWNNLKNAEVDELLKAWRSVGRERKMKMIAVDIGDLQTKVEEMIIED